MASSASVSQMIFFVAATIVAASLAGVVIGVGYEMGKKIDDQGELLGDGMATDVAIINDPIMVPYSNGNLTIYVENIGTSVMTTFDLMVMLDGRYINDTTARVEGTSSDDWGPSTVLVVTIEADLAQGDHSIKVITDNGRSDVFTFRI